ncbi:MAG TPA: flavodoxin domain-containing protein [Anaerolineales bacterium]|nr:flavodoxin domain-containing protein [Anaerolineales bacterium]
MTPKHFTRRDFLKTVGMTLGASALVCSGLGFAATRSPETDLPELFYGRENTTNKRILITYATRAGSTIEVAAAIGKTLAQRDFSVDVKPSQDRPQVDGYDAVLVGSAIRMGSWLPEAVKFVENNQSGLSQMPTAFFTVHIGNIGDDKKSRSARLAYLDPVRTLVKPVDEVYFAGKMDFSRLSFLDRLLVSDDVEEDLRDWDVIRGWARTILA